MVELQYDLSGIDDAIAKLKALKTQLPVNGDKILSSTWDYLYTGLSNGDMIDALQSFSSLTDKRAIEINILLDNIIHFLKNARNKMTQTDNQIASDLKNKR